MKTYLQDLMALVVLCVPTAVCVSPVGAQMRSEPLRAVPFEQVVVKDNGRFTCVNYVMPKSSRSWK